MAISGVTESTLIQPKDAVGNKELQRNDFMTLFITQLQYQDPMKPMDSYEMASQLAQFSSMEATMKMSESMDQLLEYQTSQNNLQILDLLGSEVQIEGNRMGIVDGNVTSTEFSLEGTAASVMLEVYDAADRKVWQQDMGALESGIYELEWDGMNMLGEQVVDGAYSYVVKAYDQSDRQVDVNYRTTGKVTGVNFDGGTALLTLDEYIGAGVNEVVKVQQKNANNADIQ